MGYGTIQSTMKARSIQVEGFKAVLFILMAVYAVKEAIFS